MRFARFCQALSTWAGSPKTSILCSVDGKMVNPAVLAGCGFWILIAIKGFDGWMLHKLEEVGVDVAVISKPTPSTYVI